MKKILVIVAHPDDEILGLGGTLIKEKSKGNQLHCLILADGVMSRENASKDDVIKRKKEMELAGDLIGFSHIYTAKFPDNKFDSVPLMDIVKTIENNISKVKPDIIYTHHPGDVNIDHSLTFDAVMTACRPCNNDGPKEIYSFETLSSSEWQLKNSMFKPNVFVDIEKTINKKIEALKSYESELREYPHSRSIEGVEILAKYRGLQSNLKYAEGFHLERMLK